jgi:hypothetical protein
LGALERAPGGVPILLDEWCKFDRVDGGLPLQHMENQKQVDVTLGVARKSSYYLDNLRVWRTTFNDAPHGRTGHDLVEIRNGQANSNGLAKHPIDADAFAFRKT